MANIPGSSFIPKRSTGKVKNPRAGKRVYILSYIAYIFFFGTLVTVVGIFFLNRQAEAQLDSHVAMLAEEQQNFQQERLDAIQNLNRRLISAEQILESHLATSRIFDEFEPVVVETVQINEFSFERSNEGQSTVSFSGATDSFDELMFQREIIETSEFFSGANFVQVTFGDSENVIEGANREGVQQDERPQPSRINFVFEDSSIAEKIGYQPRNLSNDSPGQSGGNSESSETSSSRDAVSAGGEISVNPES